MTLDDIFANVTTEPNCGCWIWNGKWDASGYGVTSDGRPAYRVSYEAATGQKIAKGSHIDHLCRVKCCVNPHHLEEVSVSENFRRKREIGGSVHLFDFSVSDTRIRKKRRSSHNVSEQPIIRLVVDNTRECDTISSKLVLLMERENISRVTLARMFGMSASGVDNWVDGEKRPVEPVVILVDLLIDRPELFRWMEERYKAAHGGPVPRKGPREKSKKRRSK